MLRATLRNNKSNDITTVGKDSGVVEKLPDKSKLLKAIIINHQKPTLKMIQARVVSFQLQVCH